MVQLVRDEKILDLIDHHQKYRPSHCAITMMTFETDTPETCGIVELDSKRCGSGFSMKKSSNPPGNRANAAVYIIEPEIISGWKSEIHLISAPKFYLISWAEFSRCTMMGFIVTLAALKVCANQCRPGKRITMEKEK